MRQKERALEHLVSEAGAMRHQAEMDRRERLLELADRHSLTEEQMLQLIKLAEGNPLAEVLREALHKSRQLRLEDLVIADEKNFKFRQGYVQAYDKFLEFISFLVASEGEYAE